MGSCLQLGATQIVLIGDITPPIGSLVYARSGDNAALQMLIDIAIAHAERRVKYKVVRCNGIHQGYRLVLQHRQQIDYTLLIEFNMRIITEVATLIEQRCVLVDQIGTIKCQYLQQNMLLVRVG